MYIYIYMCVCMCVYIYIYIHHPLTNLYPQYELRIKAAVKLFNYPYQ